MLRLNVLAGALAALPLLTTAAHAQGGAASLLEALSSSRVASELPEGYAAVGRGTLLTFEELDRTLVRRHAMAPVGRDLLKHLVDMAVLEHLAEERGIEIPAAELARMWGVLDEQIQAAYGSTLPEYLASQGISVAEFRDTLRLGLVHERLTARSLGLPEGRAPTGEEQRIWLDQTIDERGLEEMRPPFEEGLAARCGEGVEIGAGPFVEALRENVAPDAVDEACFHLLLELRLLERTPTLGDPESAEHTEWVARLESAVDAELDRRRAEALANPKYQGIPYETLLSAQGFLVEDLREDPMVRVAALTSALVEREYDHAALETEYGRRRDWYEGRFGAAVRARWLLLRAARLTNELQDRSFEAALEALADIEPAVGTEQLFADAAARLSEDVLTRPSGGDLGWVHRDEPRLFPQLRDAVLAGAAAGEVPEGGRLVGPVELPEGVALLWIVEKRPSPGWGEVMRGHVRQELRRALVEDTLLPGDVRSFMEQLPATEKQRED